ncbi:uncharacterized protein LOC122364646 [Amphibalanus amphitrite]|uniref:uncharacterized protein LOC122364646 n=1 Tax=Amphibalanus amphitrite TaxID=1232801 RepID=UPI001C91495B|nr:uncharacterized protein LOC122364646 [Amphibalanus amphitrite]
MIDEHRAEIDLCGLEPNDVTRLLTHCLENNVFEFDNEFYRQRVGIAMGNKVAPPVAIIFMHKFETRALDNAVLKPEFYSRYIDDSIGVWTHGRDELNKFLEYLNSIHPRIKFTLEDSRKEKEAHGRHSLDTLCYSYRIQLTVLDGNAVAALTETAATP